MKPRRALIFLIFGPVSGLLLGTLVGCHRPASAVVLLPEPPKVGDYPSIYLEKGGTVEFLAEGKIDQFTVTAPDGVCKEGATFQSSQRAKRSGHSFSPQSATCHVILAQAQQVEFKVNDSRTHAPIKEVKAYIRPCRPGC